MHVPRRPVVEYDLALWRADCVAKGWDDKDLAAKARVSKMRVSRFFDGSFQTAKTAKALADALGRSVRRYILTSSASKATTRRTRPPRKPRGEDSREQRAVA
jgi:transcriptional regulator with XRE-family HTH domain